MPKKSQNKGVIEYYRPKKIKTDAHMKDEIIDKLLNDSDNDEQNNENNQQYIDQLSKYQQEQEEEDSENIDSNDEEEEEEEKQQYAITQDNKIGVWEDEDDQNITVDISKVARLRKLRNFPEEKEIPGDEYQRRLKKFYNEKLGQSSFYAWAFKDQEFQHDSDIENSDQELEENEFQKQELLDKILKQDYSILRQKNTLENLPQEILDLEKYGQIRFQDKHDAVIQNIDFHQNSQLFLTCGLDKMVKIFNIKDQKSMYKDKVKLIKSIYLENLPIENAQFISQKGEIVASGLKKHLLVVDLQKDSIEKVSSYLFTNKFHKKLGKFVLSKNEKYIGLYNKDGFFVMILDAQTKQFIFEIKVTEAIASIDFSLCGQFIFILGIQGSIFQYCLNKRQIFDVIQDESIDPLVIKCGKNQLATGSASGIVNLYMQNTMDQKMIPKPLKEFQNLTTEVSCLEFNQANEALFFASRWKKSSVRMSHIPSYNVFQNWPNFKTNLSYVSNAAFSPDNKFLGVGNEKGLVSIYNLQHYNNIYADNNI